MFWIVAGQTLAVLGSLVGVRLLTRNLEPEEYGGLALGMTISTFTAQILFAPVGQAAVRYFRPAVDGGALNAFLRVTARLTGQATLLYGLVTICATVVLWTTGGTHVIPMILAAAMFGMVANIAAAR